MPHLPRTIWKQKITINNIEDRKIPKIKLNMCYFVNNQLVKTKFIVNIRQGIRTT